MSEEGSVRGPILRGRTAEKKEVEARLGGEMVIYELHCYFMPEKRSRDSIFALRILMVPYEGPLKEFHCVFVCLEKKTYDRTPREYCIRKSGYVCI